MALLKYFKSDKKRLPHPSGPLSIIVPSSSIATANEEVKVIVTGEKRRRVLISNSLMFPSNIVCKEFLGFPAEGQQSIILYFWHMAPMTALHMVL